MLIIDCGTTNLRMTVLDSGRVLAQAQRDGGVRHTAIDGDDHRLRESLREAAAEVAKKTGRKVADLGPCVAYGMITSNMGLVEVPHLVAPAGLHELHAGIHRAEFPDLFPFPIDFIPGVRNFAGPVGLENYGGMDMMRGEETETMGLISLMGIESECLLVLPGSHNKIVHVDSKGRIAGCMTSISGELLDAVSKHTILADAVERDFVDAEHLEEELVLEGARECMRSGLGRAAFAGRILNTLGKMEASKIQSYLLGAVLQQDAQALRSFDEDGSCPVFVAGKETLQRGLLAVLRENGFAAWEVPAEMSAQMGLEGALRIAQGDRK